jgi:hypothetical protein
VIRRSVLVTALRTFLLAAAAFALAAGAPAPAPLVLGSGHALVPRLRFTDQLGITHTRLVHTYHGLRVLGSEVIAHQPGLPLAHPEALSFRPTGSPALPGLDLDAPAPAPLDLDLEPSVDLAQAEGIVRAQPGAGTAVCGSSELVVAPRYVDLPAGRPGRGPDGVFQMNAARLARIPAGYALAWLIRAGNEDGSDDGGADYLVDAHTGRVLDRTPAAENLAPARGTGQSMYSGTVSMATAFDPGTGRFELVDTTRGRGPVLPSGKDYGGNAVTDMEHSALDRDGNLIVGSSNSWGSGRPPQYLGSTTSPDGLSVAADAAYGVQTAWDYFRAIHGRNGVDDSGGQILIKVNWGGWSDQFDNASWNTSSRTLKIYDGRTYWPAASLLTLAHEFTHGVTGTSANLAYKGESGGLNEATSDIFAAMVDVWSRSGRPAQVPDPGTNWHRSEVPYANPGIQVVNRYLDQPSRDGISPDAWNPGLGTLDVHYSSGPMNRAFYFLSRGASGNPADPVNHSPYLPGGMAGIGNDAAARIWYRALTVYLVASSTYLDARSAALRAASDLYGNPSPQALAVRRAFAAINVGDPDADDLIPPAFAATVNPSGLATPSGSLWTFSVAGSLYILTNEVDYLVDGIPVASRPGSATSPDAFRLATFDAAHRLANGSHTLTALAFSKYGNAGASAPAPFTTANPVQQVLSDPGFEGGGQGWTGDLDRVVRTDYGATEPHDGSFRYAGFDRGSGRQRLAIAQRVAIPAGAAARFSLWTWTRGNPALGQADSLQVAVQPQGQAPVALDTLSSLQDRQDWVQRSYDLSAFQGRTVTLSLSSDINPGTGTVFRVDDLALACSAAVPQVGVQVSLDPASFPPGPPTVDVFAANPQVGPLYAQVTGVANGAGAGVTWSAPAGFTLMPSSPSAPVFRAPATPGYYPLTATSQADPTVSAQVSVRVLGPVTVTPSAAALAPGAALPFQVLAAPGVAPAVSPGAGGGTVQAGAAPGQWLYLAPATPGTYTVTVSDPVSGSTAPLAITVNHPVQVQVAPQGLDLATGASATLNVTITGAADATATWTVQEGDAGGTLAVLETAAGPATAVLYTAPASPGSYHVTATSLADPTQSATATVTVQPNLAITPAAATVAVGASFAFQASASLGQPITWMASGGSNPGRIDSLGVYRAPAVPGTCVVSASVPGPPVRTATATVQVVSGLVIAPNQPAVAVGATITFSASAPGGQTVLWTVAGGPDPGAIDGTGAYTAPASPGTYIITAAVAGNPAQTLSTTVTVVDGAAIIPGRATVLTGAALAFLATAPGGRTVAWSLPGGPASGSIDGTGIYTAPSAPGTYAVTATPSTGAPASVQVTVKTSNLSGDGQPVLNAADLAILADAYGTAGDSPADLNGDQVVDDQDAALLFSRFGGEP